MLAHYRNLILLTPVYLFLQWIPGLIHEYSHSFTAWLFGFKSHPLDITYGNLNWQNILFAAELDENVNYPLIFLLGHPKLAALIAMMGPTIGAVGIYLLSLYLLNCNKVKNHPYLLYFIFLLNITALSELISYIYLRAFSSAGDVAMIVKGLNISPWWIFIGAGSCLGFAIYYFLDETITQMYRYLHISSVAAKRTLLLACLFLLFGIPALRMLFMDFGVLSKSLGFIMCIMIPALFVIFALKERKITKK